MDDVHGKGSFVNEIGTAAGHLTWIQWAWQKGRRNGGSFGKVQVASVFEILKIFHCACALPSSYLTSYALCCFISVSSSSELHSDS